MICVGIDLAGKEETPTGFAFLNNSNIRHCFLNRDKYLVEACGSVGLDITAVDAPFSFSEDGGFRKADYELIIEAISYFLLILVGWKFLLKEVNVCRIL